MLPNGERAKPKTRDTKATPRHSALARGHRWLAILESGEVKSFREIVEREKIDNSYVSRMVNLTCLSPDIVVGILEDELPNHITMFELAVDPVTLWIDQKNQLKITES
jgi:hypothetical protein